MFRQFIKEESGFSLTEILVVIVIIGILILLAMPKFTSVITRAKTTIIYCLDLVGFMFITRSSSSPDRHVY